MADAHDKWITASAIWYSGGDSNPYAARAAASETAMSAFPSPEHGRRTGNRTHDLTLIRRAFRTTELFSQVNEEQQEQVRPQELQAGLVAHPWFGRCRTGYSSPKEGLKHVPRERAGLPAMLIWVPRSTDIPSLGSRPRPCYSKSAGSKSLTSIEVALPVAMAARRAPARLAAADASLTASDAVTVGLEMSFVGSRSSLSR